ncbi:MAG TPA: hypothetical protein VFV92_13520, partial [Candidatus Bathyarchaeia archaeon]|nr:hypothetical protein [Candidatus Bathyarchaeia archaeon]
AHGFVPNPGYVDKFVAPGGPGIRVDTALFDGAPVPEFYDSLIAKVAAHGLTRNEVIERMRVALGEMIIEGVKTTIPVHQEILAERRFLQGNYHTQFLDKMLAGWKPTSITSPEDVAAMFLAMKLRGSEPPRIESRAGKVGWRSGLQQHEVGKPALYVEGV